MTEDLHNSLWVCVCVCEGVPQNASRVFVDIWVAHPNPKLRDLFARGEEGTVRGLLRLHRKPQYLSSANSNSFALEGDITVEAKAAAGI